MKNKIRLLYNCYDEDKNNEIIEKFLIICDSYISLFNQTLNNVNQDRRINDSFINQVEKCLNKFIIMRKYLQNSENNIAIFEYYDYQKKINEIKNKIDKIRKILNGNKNCTIQYKYRENLEEMKNILIDIFNNDFEKLNDSFKKDFILEYYKNIYIEYEKYENYKNLSTEEKEKLFIINIYNNFMNENIKEFERVSNKIKNIHY